MSKAKTVLGKDLMLFTNAKALALATSCKLTVSAETMDTQSKDSGIWTDKDIKSLSWSGSSDNAFSADKDVNGYDTLFALMVSCALVDINFGIPANATKLGIPDAGWTLPASSYAGKARITSLDLNAPDGDKATYTVNFEGAGPLQPSGASTEGIKDPTA